MQYLDNYKETNSSKLRANLENSYGTILCDREPNVQLDTAEKEHFLSAPSYLVLPHISHCHRYVLDSCGLMYLSIAVEKKPRKQTKASRYGLLSLLHYFIKDLVEGCANQHLHTRLELKVATATQHEKDEL